MVQAFTLSTSQLDFTVAAVDAMLIVPLVYVLARKARRLETWDTFSKCHVAINSLHLAELLSHIVFIIGCSHSKQLSITTACLVTTSTSRVTNSAAILVFVAAVRIVYFRLFDIFPGMHFEVDNRSGTNRFKFWQKFRNIALVMLLFVLSCFFLAIVSDNYVKVMDFDWAGISTSLIIVIPLYTSSTAFALLVGSATFYCLFKIARLMWMTSSTISTTKSIDDIKPVSNNRVKMLALLIPIAILTAALIPAGINEFTGKHFYQVLWVLTIQLAVCFLEFTIAKVDLFDEEELRSMNMLDPAKPHETDLLGETVILVAQSETPHVHIPRRSLDDDPWELEPASPGRASIILSRPDSASSFTQNRAPKSFGGSSLLNPGSGRSLRKPSAQNLLISTTPLLQASSCEYFQKNPHLSNGSSSDRGEIQSGNRIFEEGEENSWRV
jgi:hypothetical protein